MITNNKYFSGRDLRLIESLKYDSSLKPSYEFLKSCLVWPDEVVDDLTPEGYEKLCDLLIARSYIHRGLPFSAHPLDPIYFENAWKTAVAESIKWPGFNRLDLTPEERAFYEKMLSESNIL